MRGRGMRILSILIVLASIILLAVIYCHFHPNSRICFLHPRKPSSKFLEMPLPTVEEPTTDNKSQTSLGVYPGEPQNGNGEISFASGPGSFDIAQDAIAITDPIHLRVVVGHISTLNGEKTFKDWTVIPTDFPPVRVRLKDGQLLIQEYEGPSDSDLVCTTKPLHCDIIARFLSNPAQLSQLRGLRASILQQAAPVPSRVHPTEELGGSKYLGDDRKGNTYYLVDYVGPDAAREGAFHFRKYSPDGTLADESPSLPEDNDVRILDRARADDDGVCYWLSVRLDSQAQTMLWEWRAK